MSGSMQKEGYRQKVLIKNSKRLKLPKSQFLWHSI
uniref:Uncharacterized protein n=1 Tax=Rhizophora mucronata TaxID=61149 RepID=A0A2P2IQA7_RHIMU